MGVTNLLRAATTHAVRGRPPSPPDTVLSATTGADQRRLRAYAQLCGFTPGPLMPPTYPHVLAFDLVMRLMTRRDFPFAAPGLVHVRNTITAHRPIEAGAALTFRVHAGEVAGHPKGRTVEIVTTAGVGGAECWTERSIYLHRETSRHPPTNAGSATPGDERADALPAAVTWDLPEGLGRSYARVSGDWNPIHLSRWTARPFGYRRPIAHGMWTMARTLSAMEALPESFTADVSFAAPILLPSRVQLTTDGERVAVRPVDSPGARPHLVGSVADVASR